MMVTDNVQRIGIVTCSPPGENGVGQNYMRDIVDALSGHQVHMFAVLKDQAEWRDQDRRCIAGYDVLGRRYEYRKGFGPGVIGRLSADVAFNAVTVPHAKRLAKQIIESIACNQLDRVLVVLESPLLMLVADAICKHAACPVQILVWDHPEHIAKNFGHCSTRQRKLLATFRSVVSQSDGAITVAESLKQYLSNVNPGLSIRLFRCPVCIDQRDPQTTDRPCESPFTIGFAGSVTAPDELELLQQSLDRLHWRVDGRPIVLRLFGKRFVLSASHGRNVQYRGFLPTQRDVIQGLAECDVCFLPQPFSSARRLVAEYSFPTKLSTYLSSGKPILVLAPGYASLSKYQCHGENTSANESLLGFQCESSSVEVMSELIQRIVRDESYYEFALKRTTVCAEKSFRADAGALNVRTVLGVE